MSQWLRMRWTHVVISPLVIVRVTSRVIMLAVLPCSIIEHGHAEYKQKHNGAPARSDFLLRQAPYHCRRNANIRDCSNYRPYRPCDLDGGKHYVSEVGSVYAVAQTGDFTLSFISPSIIEVKAKLYVPLSKDKHENGFHGPTA